MGAMRGGGEGQKVLCDVGNAEDEGRSADDGSTRQTEPQGGEPALPSRAAATATDIYPPQPFSAPVLLVQLGLDVHLSRSS
ncbi:hypothetical protein BD309DRAFT_849445 [Dichomitus squalens]|uniref:Uncharacterized protein n=1 Tax=Dichomitus squalens TaxID=114155 RepID=A0A4Q9Q8E3_9APHY|nr:hypothetical protein BD309DRAFT_849445 [Dichomitus squalens]TBU62874.1 hypothetical protein BD310DRAFT_809705 [Dichomitus squalens]